MYCKKCGKELEEKYKFCPVCGEPVSASAVKENVPDMDMKDNKKKSVGVDQNISKDEIREYKMRGIRSSFSPRVTASIPSIIKIQGEDVEVITEIGSKKNRRAEFRKKDIQDINFKVHPLVWKSDIFRIVIFALFLPITYGLSIVALLWSVYLMCSRNMVLILNDGRKIYIPLMQDSDSIPFLQELDYPSEKIQKLENKRISEKQWYFRRMIVSLLLVAAAAGTATLGMDMAVQNINADKKNTYESTLSEVNETYDISEEERHTEISENPEKEETTETPENAKLTETSEISNNDIFAQLPRGFDFSSGAGGWATHFDLNSDGTFSGQYLDSDMGDTGNGYSDGTVYICNFVGKFSAPKQVSTYVYSMELEYLNTDGKPGDTYYDQDIRYIHSEPYGLDNADEFLIYFPGVKMTDLPEGFISWLGQSIYAQTTETLNCYGIYNVNAEEGFVAADNSSAAKTIRDIDLADYLDGIDNLIPQYLNFLESEDYYLYVDDTRMVSVYCDEYQIPQYIDIACDADVSPSFYGIRIGMDEWDAVDKVPSTYTLIEAEEVGYTYYNLDDKTYLIWWTDEDTSKITRIVYLTEYGYDNYWTPPGMNLQYILPESAERVYSVDELAYLSDDEIQMAINEIYARHGRKFKDAYIQAYFDNLDWYVGTIEPQDFSDSVLSSIEKENLRILTSMR